MRDPNTEVGGSGEALPTTYWSLIREASQVNSSEYRAAHEALAKLYWRPVYAYIRRRWRKPSEEAKDLTQEFFVSLTERNPLGRLDPAQGRFRSYVMASLDNLARLEHRRQSRKKRGGGRQILEFDGIEGFEPTDRSTPEKLFRQEWIRSIMEGALLKMEQEYRSKGQESRYNIFRAREIDSSEEGKTSYDALAEKFGLGVADVKNVLYLGRLHLRKMVLERIRETVTNEKEAQEEMEELFGTAEA